MSAPTYADKRADTINFSFLSLRASAALKAALGGAVLVEEDREVLLRAERFLRDIANGASVASTGEFRHGATDPIRAVDALDYAFGPLEQLSQAVLDKDIAAFFEATADAVAALLAPQPALTNEVKDQLRFAVDFFDVLYKSLASTMDFKPERSAFGFENWRVSTATA